MAAIEAAVEGLSWEEFFNQEFGLSPNTNEYDDRNILLANEDMFDGVATLPYKKATCYGICTTSNTPRLVECQDCGLVVKMVAFGHHRKIRHADHNHPMSPCTEDSDSEDDCQHFLLSPPHLHANQTSLVEGSTSEVSREWAQLLNAITYHRQQPSTSKSALRIRRNMSKRIDQKQSSNILDSAPFYEIKQNDLKLILKRTPEKLYSQSTTIRDIHSIQSQEIQHPSRKLKRTTVKVFGSKRRRKVVKTKKKNLSNELPNESMMQCEDVFTQGFNDIIHNRTSSKLINEPSCQIVHCCMAESSSNNSAATIPAQIQISCSPNRVWDPREAAKQPNIFKEISQPLLSITPSQELRHKSNLDKIAGPSILKRNNIKNNRKRLFEQFQQFTGNSVIDQLFKFPGITVTAMKPTSSKNASSPPPISMQQKKQHPFSLKQRLPIEGVSSVANIEPSTTPLIQRGTHLGVQTNNITTCGLISKQKQTEHKITNITTVSPSSESNYSSTSTSDERIHGRNNIDATERQSSSLNNNVLLNMNEETQMHEQKMSFNHSYAGHYLAQSNQIIRQNKPVEQQRFFFDSGFNSTHVEQPNKQSKITEQIGSDSSITWRRIDSKSSPLVQQRTTLNSSAGSTPTHSPQQRSYTFSTNNTRFVPVKAYGIMTGINRKNSTSSQLDQSSQAESSMIVTNELYRSTNCPDFANQEHLLIDNVSSHVSKNSNNDNELNRNMEWKRHFISPPKSYSSEKSCNLQRTLRPSEIPPTKSYRPVYPSFPNLRHESFLSKKSMHFHHQQQSIFSPFNVDDFHQTQKIQQIRPTIQQFIQYKHNQQQLQNQFSIISPMATDTSKIYKCSSAGPGQQYMAPAPPHRKWATQQLGSVFTAIQQQQHHHRIQTPRQQNGLVSEIAVNASSHQLAATSSNVSSSNRERIGNVGNHYDLQQSPSFHYQQPSTSYDSIKSAIHNSSPPDLDMEYMVDPMTIPNDFIDHNYQQIAADTSDGTVHSLSLVSTLPRQKNRHNIGPLIQNHLIHPTQHSYPAYFSMATGSLRRPHPIIFGGQQHVSTLTSPQQRHIMLPKSSPYINSLNKRHLHTQAPTKMQQHKLKELLKNNNDSLLDSTAEAEEVDPPPVLEAEGTIPTIGGQPHQLFSDRYRQKLQLNQQLEEEINVDGRSSSAEHSDVDLREVLNQQPHFPM